LIGGLLLQIAALLSPRRSAMFVEASGPLFDVQSAPMILAGTGRFAPLVGAPAAEQIAAPTWSDIMLATESARPIHRDHYSVFGLCHEERSCAALYIETQGPLSGWESHLLELFCRNATVAFDNLRLHRQEVALTKIFERFVPKQALELMDVVDVTTVAVGDHVQREMTVIFVDLRSFTRIAEQLGTAATFTFVNAFFAALVPAIHGRGGMVDSYTGDGLIALFPGASADALHAGFDLIAATEQFADRNPELPLRPRIGVGIHRGPMILGLCGAVDRLAFTAVGDCVNVAARVERLTREYDSNLLLTGAVHAGLPASLQAGCRRLGLVGLRGKQQEVELFEASR
jgi:class 3 adenylate cyclase